MKFLLAYVAIQIIAFAIFGFQEPLVLAATPLVLIGNYALLIVFYNVISGRGFRL